MAEKVIGEKEDRQQANKKSQKNQQQPKKKRNEPQKLSAVPAEKTKKKKFNQNSSSNQRISMNTNDNNNINKKSKEKRENKNHVKKGPKRNVNKPAGGFCRTLFKLLFFTVASALMFLGFLYIVDIKKYHSILLGGENALYRAGSFLPLAVVNQGEKVYFNYVRPMVVVAVDKVLVLVNHASTELNTNPAFKDHWSNINEISAVVGERLAEFMRTVYKQIPIYYDYAKNKLF